jgi:hypothetical protein
MSGWDTDTSDELDHWRGQAKALAKTARRYRKERNQLRDERDRLTQELFKISGGWPARIEARRALDEQLEQLRREVDELRSERNYWRDATLTARRHRDGLGERLDAAERAHRIDGDLLADIIANQCPLWMTTEAACDLAEEAVKELARYDDITVLRGTHNEPWTETTETTNETNTNTDLCDAGPACTVDVTMGADEWFEYAVFTTTDPDDGPTCLVNDVKVFPEALALAQHIPGAWVERRRVVPQHWTTMTDPTPNPAAS